MKRAVWCAIGNAIVLALMSGCGSKSELCSARGKVFVDGKPADGAIVVFHPENSNELTAIRPSTRVAADGSFVLEAPPGEYRVAVMWFDDLNKYDRITGTVATRLPARFGDPQQSTLRTVIGPRDTEIPTFQIEN